MKALLLGLLLICFSVFGQEEFNVKFKYGRPDIPANQIDSLRLFIKGFDKSGIDSIHFIGSSESAGIFLSNFRMTEWRARRLRRFCSNAIKASVPYKILPTENKGMGEVRDTKSVSLVVYRSNTLTKKDLNRKVESLEGCYRVAYSALKSCHVRFENNGSRGYVFLEKYFPMSTQDDQKYFYGSRDEKGAFLPVQLKWKLTRTGKQHWKGQRYVAKIPFAAFDKYKIFTIEEKPCSACHEDFDKLDKIENDQPKNLPDYVLMEQLQYRQPWVLTKNVIVRIPKEYVDLDMQYVAYRTPVEWEEKEKSPNYYFAKVSQFDGKVDIIHRPFRVPIEKECESETKAKIAPPKLRCAPSNSRSEVTNFVEVGMHSQNSTSYPYVAIGVYAGTNAIELEFLSGMHQKGAFYGSIRARYNILSVPFNAISSGSSWRHSMIKNRFWYSRLYCGVEYKASLGTRTPNYLEPNLNVGLSIAQNGNPTFQRFFVQFGRGVNFYLESPHVSYSVFQFGALIHLGKKEYRKEEGVL